jgi:hypothetical protein
MQSWNPSKVLNWTLALAAVVVVVGALVTFAIYDNEPPSTQQRVHTTLAAIDNQLKGKTPSQQRKLLAVETCKSWRILEKDTSAPRDPNSYASRVTHGLVIRFNRRFNPQSDPNNGNTSAIMGEMRKHCSDIPAVRAPD